MDLSHVSFLSWSQKLDEASAAGLARLQDKDKKIDEGIDRLDHTIDNIATISTAMKHEVSISASCVNEVK